MDRPIRDESVDLLDTIRAGDRVTILIPNGIGRHGVEWKEKTGRAVMRGPAGWVLNMGGRYGTPGIAGPDNIVRIKPATGVGRTDTIRLRTLTGVYRP